MSIGYKNITKCQIGPAISDSDTTVLLENISDYVPFLNAPGDYVYAVLVDSSNSEIIKIDVAASSTSGLSAARGQGGTTARAWRRGTLLYQELTAESLDEIFQQTAFRTVEYNPNGVLSPAYAGEKIYQADATACKKRWWKAWDATNPIWLLIAGTICDGERIIYPTDPVWDFTTPSEWLDDWSLYQEIPTFDIVKAGYLTMVGRKPNGELWGWGSNQYNQLAQDAATSQVWTPVRVSELTTWSYLAAGEKSIYAIKNDGTLWVCGYNNKGQLGLGDTTDRTELTQVGSGTTWAKVWSNYWSVFALKSDDTLWVWGFNNRGQLGLNDKTDRTSPTQLGALTTWSEIACFNESVLALKTDGTLWGWGRNYGGELGLGDRVERLVPTQVGALTTWSKIAIGDYRNSLALKTDGTLWAWGDNLYGCCGQGDDGAGVQYNYIVPTQIGVLTTWVSIAVSGTAGCAAIKTDGTLWTWGYATSVSVGGQLGQWILGANVKTPTKVDNDTDWDVPAGGCYGSLHILKTDTTLYAAGYEPYGLLGLGELGGNLYLFYQL